MFYNYFKTAWRNLNANKFYSILNICGLAVGLTTGIMLLLWVQNEFSYDKFNKNAGNIYRVNSSFKISNGDNSFGSDVPAPLKPFSASVPDIEDIVRINHNYSVSRIRYQSKKLFNITDNALYVDDHFFQMLSFPLRYGNAADPFPQTNSIILSETMAKNLFGSDRAVGKVLTINDNESYTVSGIMKDMPQNTSIDKADILFPMAAWAKAFGGNGDWKTIDEDLGSFQYKIFIRLRNGANPGNVARHLTAIFNEHQAAKYKGLISFLFQPLTSIHLVREDGSASALHMVQVIMWVAILILLIASINYVNLSTARSLVRLKEVSIKKIVGANKLQLFYQFITETLLIFLIAFVGAVLLAIALMPLYNSISGKDLVLHLSDIRFWKIISFVLGSTLIASGVYPAILLSSFNPLSALKGKIYRSIGTTFLRRALVVAQFSVSVMIIISTIVMGRQMRYIKTKDVGYDKSYVFMVYMPGDMYRHSEAVISELKKENSIISVGAAACNISNIGSSSGDMEVPGKSDLSLRFFETEVDKDFIPTMKLQFASGHNFTGTPSDSSSYIINETAANAIGMKNDAVGKTVTYHGKKGTIIGVLKDFNFESLKEVIKPVIIGAGAWWYQRSVLYVRTTSGQAQEAINAVQRQYKKYVNDTPFSYNFLDKSFEAQYKSEQRTGVLFITFATIAIFISCLGLFGLATYTAQIKTKEIGIRKVIGASVSSIIQLISKDFLKLVAIAIIIAVPFAWIAMNEWLEDFAYRTTISWWIIALAAIISLLIAFVTVSFQAIRAAMANPVKSLRTE